MHAGGWPEHSILAPDSRWLLSRSFPHACWLSDAPLDQAAEPETSRQSGHPPHSCGVQPKEGCAVDFLGRSRGDAESQDDRGQQAATDHPGLPGELEGAPRCRSRYKRADRRDAGRGRGVQDEAAGERRRQPGHRGRRPGHAQFDLEKVVHQSLQAASGECLGPRVNRAADRGQEGAEASGTGREDRLPRLALPSLGGLAFASAVLASEGPDRLPPHATVLVAEGRFAGGSDRLLC